MAACPATAATQTFPAFIGTGAILGFIVGSYLGWKGDTVTASGRSFSVTSSVLFLGVVGACLVGLLGAVVAVLLDRRD